MFFCGFGHIKGVPRIPQLLVLETLGKEGEVMLWRQNPLIRTGSYSGWMDGNSTARLGRRTTLPHSEKALRSSPKSFEVRKKR